MTSSNGHVKKKKINIRLFIFILFFWEPIIYFYWWRVFVSKRKKKKIWQEYQIISHLKQKKHIFFNSFFTSLNVTIWLEFNKSAICDGPTLNDHNFFSLLQINHNFLLFYMGKGKKVMKMFILNCKAIPLKYMVISCYRGLCCKFIKWNFFLFFRSK